MALLFRCVLLLSFTGCLTLPQGPAGPERIKKVFDERTMRVEIARVLPVGTDMQKATSVMEKNGFRCEYRMGDDTSTEVPCLRCILTYQQHMLYLDKIIVWLYYDANGLTKIRVLCLQIGP
jgi:hypothetical protein